MTTPAPFPPALETAIAQALADHRYDGTRNWCICRVKVGYDLIAHQAAVVMETIAQHTTTEWGVRWEGSSEVDMTGHESTSREFVRQGADHGFVDVAVARLVLPWQEVKA